MLTETQITELKARLEKERDILEQELASLGSRNPNHPGDWEPKKPEGEETSPDRNDNADIIEAMHENNASMNELEGRFNNVMRALKKIGDGNYGICEVSEEPIEFERLEANPAARTCLKHIDQEVA
ncbi:MAG: TraR/DksA family transcriptional regulator [Patescibacteria group bacterium UBA2163]